MPFLTEDNLLILQPEIIGTLPSLQELWLDGNDLTELPPVSLSELTVFLSLLKALVLSK